MVDTAQPDNYPKSPWDYTPERYMEILTKADELKAPTQRIAIIGAGMAGLVAGCLLKRAGQTVTLFEAKHAVGGRVKTLRERFTSDFYAEAGAMRIPDHHPLTKWLAYKVFGEKPLEFVNKNDNGIIYINNQRTTFGKYQANPNILGFQLNDNELGKSAQDIFDICLEDHICHLAKHGNKASLRGFKIRNLYYGAEAMAREDLNWIMKKLDKYSLRYFLSHVARFRGVELSQGAIDMISAVLVYEMEMSCSMAFIISQYMEFNAREFTQIKGGMDRLPKGFVDGIHPIPDQNAGGKKNSLPENDLPDLAKDVRYNSRVTEIMVRHPGVELRFENTMTSYKGRESFDKIIICIPFSALRHIRMYGLTSPEKRRAIRQLHYANACKILLEFNHKFWLESLPDRPSIEGGRSITDLAIRQIFYPTPKQNKDRLGRGLLLASYTWGDDSLRWTSLKHDDRVRFALRDLERVYGYPGGLARSCIGGMSHSWAEDEFTSGAFAQFEPDQFVKLFPAIWQPENRIHYAGEHTSLRHGWIEGAVESGIRVAKEVCDSLSQASK
jgi:monoamine oxidase